jgi:hypothetical protein
MAETNVQRALELAVIIMEAERRRRPSAALGFAQINYGRLFIRDYWTLFAIALELECTVADLLPSPEPAEQRSLRADMTESAESILVEIRRLPSPLSAVVLLRAARVSWRKIYGKMQGRAQFSIRDDWAIGLKIISERCASECRFLCDNDRGRGLARETRGAYTGATL